MSVLEQANPKFFNPLCCRNRNIYFECIRKLINRAREVTELYETDARSCLILYLQNCKITMKEEDIGEEVGSNRSPQENANAILNYFRQCGWVSEKEIGRSGDNIASVTTHCRELVDAITRIFDEAHGNVVLSNHIFTMYEILGSALSNNSARAIEPYTHTWKDLMANEEALRNALQTLRENIRIIMEEILRISDLNGFGEYFTKDEVLNRFFRDYFFMKSKGKIPSYISAITRMLAQLKESELYGKIIAEYSVLSGETEEAAKEQIDMEFDRLYMFLTSEYDEEMDFIADKINRYYDLSRKRVMLIKSKKGNLEQTLNELLLKLKDMDAEERDPVLTEISGAFRVMSYGFIGPASLHRRATPKRKLPEAAALTMGLLTEEELHEMTEKILEQGRDAYGLDRVQAYFDELMKGRNILSLDECPLRTRRDAMMIAAVIIYSGTTGFPYEVEFENGMVDTEVASIRRIKIRRKTHE